MSKTALVYIDKKDQAPSYCDRILFKNNSSLQIEVEDYDCNQLVFGSDHRPITLAMTIKNFDHPHFYDPARMLLTKQGYGKLEF